jgi:hypothetical protein
VTELVEQGITNPQPALKIPGTNQALGPSGDLREENKKDR